MLALCLPDGGLHPAGHVLYPAGAFGTARELLCHGYILGLFGLGLWFERDHLPAVLRADKEGLAPFRGNLPFAILTVG